MLYSKLPDCTNLSRGDQILNENNWNLSVSMYSGSKLN
jgi:hypothetical protein